MANGEIVHARPPVVMDSAVPLMRPPPTDVADENEKEQLCYLMLLQRPRTAIHTYLAGQRFQRTRELISAQKTSHKHNNKDVRNSFSAYCVNTRYINSTRGTSSDTQILRGYILRYTDTQRVHPQIHRYSEVQRMYLWWSLCTSCLHA